MAIVASDIVFYAAVNKPTDDASTNGGAIDADERVFFTDIAADDDIEVVSSNAGDTMNITVTARQENGVIDSQAVALNGTTPVVLSTLGVVERVLRALLASDAAGTITVRRQGAAGDIGTIPPGERGFRRMFINATADPSGGSTKNYYEKFFIKNNHATLSLLNAAVIQSADPTGKVAMLLASAVNDSATTANRLTAPGAADTLDPDSFVDTSQAVPGANLAAGAAIGVWLRLQLAAGDAPFKNTFTPQISGSST
jgi:hypothetical protein